MKELILVIAKALVDYPDDVRVEKEEDERVIAYQLFVHPDDVGKVIGKNGRIAKAMRTVVHAKANKSSKRVVIDIIS